MTTTTPSTARSALPRGIWVLGFVSMLMDVSSEMIHALLPVYLVTVLGASTLTVGFIEGIAEATASITKIFSGALSDWLGRRKLPGAGEGSSGVPRVYGSRSPPPPPGGVALPHAGHHLGPHPGPPGAGGTEPAAGLAGTGRVQVNSWHVMFMARGKVGPFRVDGVAHASGTSSVGVRMLLVDEGNDGKVVTSATALVDVGEG